MTGEEQRLKQDRNKTRYWRRWGSYLSERQWGAVREDYSLNGAAWDYFTYYDAIYRAYRWGEDGIMGISDNHQRLCFSVSMWNENDPFIKERLFGVSGTQGNHGEDPKEIYYYLDNTPSHSYMKALYKYPHKEYPYEKIIEISNKRGRFDPEFEIIESGLFDEDRYFDVFTEYAKKTDEDIHVKITVINRGPEEKTLHLLPTLWFKNDWSWFPDAQKPAINLVDSRKNGAKVIKAEHKTLGKRWLYADSPDEVLFTENETNHHRLFDAGSEKGFFKNGINDYVVHGRKDAINPEKKGTKASAHYILILEPGGEKIVRLRLCDRENVKRPFSSSFEKTFKKRKEEADDFYYHINPREKDPDRLNIQRQAFAGMLWNRQFYNYVVEQWLKGDPVGPEPPESRKQIRNTDWIHLYVDDVLSMPDKWEYPWFAAWDLAFHTIVFAMIDPDFAKKQLSRLTREWYMHPNGQLPAYEWNFSDVNPPVHAWAAWRVYKIERKMFGKADRLFLERVFQKLLLNFTWWVNRKDADERNVFQGGFLGLDNIGVFNRDARLPTGGHLEQSDGTAWMGMFCLNMLAIALELAEDNPAYEDIASKFFEHFLYIADAMHNLAGEKHGLWDDEDGFYYDMLHVPGHSMIPLKVRSLVGLIPLFAVETIEPETLNKFPGFEKRLMWFIENRPDLKKNVACMKTPGVGSRRLLSIVDRDRLATILQKVFDEDEFLSPYGVRSLSRYHEKNPYTFKLGDEEYRVDYEPAESHSNQFGGNSNWRGPVWFPVNYLLIETLQKYHHYYGDDLKVRRPSNKEKMNLWQAGIEISERLIKLFTRNEEGKRPAYEEFEKFQKDPHFKDYILFYEYFHPETGKGLGANHQTGWTGLVAKLLQQCSEYAGVKNPQESKDRVKA